MRALCSLVLLLLSLTFPGPAQGAEQALEPRIVLMERNPWLHIVGSDSPSFVLYENGLVIFVRTDKEHEKRELASVVLDAVEKESLLTSLQLGKALDGPKDFYRLTLTTDQPTNTLFVFSRDNVKRVHLYGSLRSLHREKEGPDLDVPPADLSALLAKLIAFHHPRAQLWQPEKVEIIVQANPGEPNQAIPWPKDLPGINHPYTIKRGALYSIYIDYPRFLELSKLVKERGGPSFLINGKTWFGSFRFPFPGEATWMRGRSIPKAKD